MRMHEVEMHVVSLALEPEAIETILLFLKCDASERIIRFQENINSIKLAGNEQSHPSLEGPAAHHEIPQDRNAFTR